MDHLYNMKAVCLRTGLSSHLIRVWEKRYRAVVPARSQARRRLYSEEEVRRLQMLARLTQAGFSIGQIASLPGEQLEELLAGTLANESRGPAATEPVKETPVTPAGFVEGALEAVRNYDGVGLERLLDKALLALGAAGLLERVLAVLLQRIGTEWSGGFFTAAQEHFASAAIREYLARNFRPMHLPDTAPHLVVATPAGQLHELGAVLAGALARKAGWKVTYLGASLPAEEIAAACRLNAACCVALSIVYPQDDPELPEQLMRLRHLLPEDVAIIAGGASAAAYGAALREIGAPILSNLRDFSAALLRLRSEGGHPRQPSQAAGQTAEEPAVQAPGR